MFCFLTITPAHFGELLTVSGSSTLGIVPLTNLNAIYHYNAYNPAKYPHERRQLLPDLTAMYT